MCVIVILVKTQKITRFHGSQTVSHSRMQLRLHAAKPCQSLGAWHIAWWYFTT